MSTVGVPIPIATGETVRIPAAPNVGLQTTAVLLANLSPLVLTVQQGNSQSWQAPWSEMAYELASNGDLPAVTGQALEGSPTGGTSALLVTYFFAGDPEPPSDQSSTLVAAAVAAAISGVVQVSGGQIEISGGQGGEVNVSTDSPPQTGPVLQAVEGQTSAEDTQTAPANATAVVVSVPADAPIPSGSTYSVVLTDSYTGEVLASALNIVAGDGQLVTAPLPPRASIAGYKTQVSVNGGGTFTSSADVAQRDYYLGTTVEWVVTNPQVPLAVVGAPLGIYSPAVIVQGNQGWLGNSAQVTPEPPENGGGITPFIIDSGKVATLIDAPSSGVIALHKMNLFSSVATELTIATSGSPSEILWSCYQGIAGAFPEVDFEGLRVGGGQSVDITNPGGSSTAISGRLSWSNPAS